MTTALRDYQERSLGEVSEAWRGGHRRVLLVQPTGSGKTRIGVEAMLRATARGKRALWLAHRRELVAQASQRVGAEGLPDHGVILADAARGNAAAPVQVASVDTMRARRVFPPADLVIWDEAHHTAAETWTAIHNRYPEAYHLGLTATPERGDGAPLVGLFDKLVVGATVLELQTAGYLVRCQVIAPPKKLKPKELAQEPLDAWQVHAAGRPTVLYTRTVGQAYQLAGDFQRIGIAAAALDGTTPTAERDATLSAFAAGEITVLANCMILTEGWDSPATEVCLVARSVGHAGMWLQMVGRVLRPSPGKAGALVLDLAGNVHGHGPPEAIREYSLEGGIKRLSHACAKCGAETLGYPCASCGYEPQSTGLKKPVETVITRDELVPFESLEIVKRGDVLRRLEAEAIERGYKPGWVFHRFKSRFNSELPYSVYAPIKQRIEAARAGAADPLFSERQP
jgi:superfamily II DNA or RNA helicase